MATTTRAAMVSTQEGEGEWDENPGTILITDDGETGRIYLETQEIRNFETQTIRMAVNLGDLMDAIKKQLAGGDR